MLLDFNDSTAPLHFRLTYPHALYGDIVNQFMLRNSVRGLRAKVKCDNQHSKRMIAAIDPEAIRSLFVDLMAKMEVGGSVATHFIQSQQSKGVKVNQKIVDFLLETKKNASDFEAIRNEWLVQSASELLFPPCSVVFYNSGVEYLAL